ncbi:MAG: hypothetical protein MUC28_04335 [Planctomycetes bacterium]|nr:hypothetical protein [Planctomycetota bacterium]
MRITVFSYKPERRLVLLLFIFTLVLAGCAAGVLEPDENVAWQNEILLASECGLDGLPCCPDQDQPCLYEQVCCSDPNGSGRNQCREQCSCGGLKEFCCAGEAPCQGDLACRQGECVPCGGENEPCCDQTVQCRGELICHLDRCLKCGLPGHPCCPDGQACRAQMDRDLARTECLHGLCAYCGFEGQAACQNPPACNDSHLLNNEKCWQCGGYNQPCCDGAETGGEICDQHSGLVCRLGFCAKK